MADTRFKKGQTPWNAGSVGVMQPNSGSFQVGQTPHNKGAVGHEAWNKGIAFEAVRDANHHMWKGDKVGYHALHMWVSRRLGKPLECSQCSKTGGTTYNYHWANLSKEYRRDLTDWKRMCVSCHKLFDLGKLEVLTNGR